jgi:hypothetical protein
MKRGALFGLAASLAVACGGARPAEVVAPSVAGGPSPAAVRVDALLAHPIVPRVRIELVAPLDPSAPNRVEANPPSSGIVFHDDVWPSRLLSTDDPGYEIDRFRRAITPCAKLDGAPFALVDLTTIVPPVAVAHGASSPFAACVATRFVGALFPPPTLRLNVRVSVHARSAKAPRPRDEVVGDRVELARRLADAKPGPERAPLALAAGSIALELALASGDGGELSSARTLFDEALVQGDDDLRPIALFGRAVAAEAALVSDEALVHYRALVCPSRYGAHAPSAPEPDRSKDVRYVSPYEGCVPLAGAPRELVGEAWDALGRFHEERDTAAGPFALDRAVTAYERSLTEGEPSPYVRLALGRVELRAHRPRAALSALRPILSREPADRAGEELRLRAAQLAASALTYFDLEGAPADAPVTDWPDLIDTEPQPAIVEQKLAVVFTRLEDPNLVPVEGSSAPLVGFWTAWELSQLALGGLASRGFSRFLSRWPLHRDAPLAAWEHARALEVVSYGLRPQTPAWTAQTKLVQEAKARLADYGPGSRWAAANASDAEALARAAQLAGAAN